MPRKKQPVTLYEITLLRVQILLIETCMKIDKRRSRKVIRHVQDHVTNSLGSIVFDTLGNQTIRHFIKECMPVAVNSKTFLEGGRKLFCLFIHSEAKTFLFNMNQLYPMVSLPVGDRFFWIDNIKTMKNVVKMDLSCVGNNVHNVFKAIGKCCKKLQELIFVSTARNSQEWNFGSSKTKSRKKMLESYRDKFCRIKYLVDCPELRVIHDVSTSFFHYELDFLRDFIRKMPRLTVLNVDNLGLILSTGMEDWTTPLALTEAKELESNPTHIRALSAHCPQLHKLTLQSIDNVNGEDYMIALAESPFYLTELSLLSCFYKFNIINIGLKNKGEHLTKLALVLINSTDCNLTRLDIIKIGRLCPKLKSLHLNDHIHGNYNEVQRMPDEDDDVFVESSELFRNLTSLDIGGKLCWRQGIVELLLKNATGITDIVVSDMYSQEWQYSVDPLIDVDNSMSELTSLQIFCNYRQLSPDRVSQLYDRFDYLKSITITSGVARDDQHLITNRVAEIQKIIRENNYDITFKLIFNSI